MTPKKVQNVQEGRDVLVAINNSSRKSTRKERSSVVKVMDFRTPKMVKRKVTTGKRLSISRRKSVNEDVAPSPTVMAPLSPPLHSSTPESRLPSQVVNQLAYLLPPGKDQVHEDEALKGPALLPDYEVPAEADRELDEHAKIDNIVPLMSKLKRKIDQTDLHIPVQLSPHKKVKKKLGGLSRELDHDANTLIIGAPKFATLARPKLVLDDSKLERRTSRRLTTAKVCNSRDVSVISTASNDRSCMINGIISQKSARPNATNPKKAMKSCIECLSLKAWSRWHNTECGSWRCHRCYKRQKVREGVKSKSTGSKVRRGRVGHQLTPEEHVLLMVRHRQGYSFNAIAKELNKWKTGQSVRTYLQKPATRVILAKLKDRIEALLAQQTDQALAPVKKRTQRKPRKDKGIPRSAMTRDTARSKPIGIYHDADVDDLNFLTS